jgi:protein arginine N-methyltransferase 1
VKENGFEKRITIIQGKVEEVELPVKQVDIIISEWMGYFLLYESMMDTVLHARDKWLKPNGILMPDKARIHICAIEDAQYRQQKLEYWNDVYGYKMSCIKATALTEPLVDVVPPQQVISDSAVIFEIDLYKAQINDLDFSSDFQITFMKKEFCHGLTAYFDVQFSKCHSAVGFTTAPFAEYTHWKQTVFYEDQPIRADENQSLRGTITVEKNKSNHRDLNIKLSTTTSYNLTQSRDYLMR